MASHEEIRVFYLCNGEVPYCGKHMCYKKENPPDDPCRHTKDVRYALNFQKKKNTVLTGKSNAAECCVTEERV